MMMMGMGWYGMADVEMFVTGKHDVGSLSHKGGNNITGASRYGTQHTHAGQSSHSIRSTRSGVLSVGE